VNAALRERFDALVQDAIDAMPPQFARALDEVPIVVVDRPDRRLLNELRRDGVLPPLPPPPHPASSGAPSAAAADGATDDTVSDEELMGLHSGVAITEQSVDGPVHMPPTIHIFRDGVVAFAGGWEQPNADDEIYEEVRITLLHELGHHFGLDENDLDDLGYA
jgi:predicted Zn-dependent protease with MMP-like domain